MLLALLAAGYGSAINLLAFALFGLDKHRAVVGGWRIREATLIWIAVLGGWLGAKAGQRRFRHKTRKQPFGRRLNGAGLLSLGLVTLVVAAALAPAPEGGWVARAWEAEAAPAVRTMPIRFGPGSGDDV